MPALPIETRRGTPMSPLRYPGGKAPLADFLAALMARRMQSRYVEPYAGGAGAAIALLITGAAEEIWINDLDPAVYSFWCSVVKGGDEVAEWIREVPLDLDTWHEQRSIYQRGDASDPLRLGLAMFYLNRTNRSGVMNAGVIGGKSQAGKYTISARFDRARLAKRVQVIYSSRDRITVTNRDGLSVLHESLQWDSCLNFVDPPYFEKGEFLYPNSFGQRQHEDLAKILNGAPRANWLLTYDIHPTIMQYYRDRTQFEFALEYSAHVRERKMELMVASDSLAGSITGSYA